MSDRIGAAVNMATTVIHYLAGMPLGSQITGAVTLFGLLFYAEVRRRTRTTPTLRTRAGRVLATVWKSARTPATAEQKEKRGDRFESLLFLFFAAVTFGLIMQGLIPFAREDMGLTGPWPYLFFFALDGMAALFAYVAFRRAQQGGTATAQRFMVAAITAGSSWFQWVHHTSQTAAGQVAWAAMPIGVAVLFETLLTQRRRAWKRKQTPDTGRQVPRARWIWDPIGSLGITRRTHMWNLDTWEDGLGTHMTRAECVRQLRREFGPFWAYRVPADVAIRLKRGFKVDEAAAMVPTVIATHRKETENRRIVREARKAARKATAPTPGVYTVTLPETPVVDLAPVPGVGDVVEPLEPAPVAEKPDPASAVWVDPAADWDPLPGEFDPFPDEVFPAPFVPTPQDTWVDPWDQAPATLQGFIPLDVPTAPATTDVSTVTPDPDPEPEFWDTIETAGETVTPAQKTSPAPADVIGYQPAPYTGPRWDEAVTLYKKSVDNGAPLASRALCKALNVSPNNRWWANKVIASANEALF